LKFSSPHRSPPGKLDPSSFLADPELLRELERRTVDVPCETDRVLFHQDDPSAGAYILRKGSVTLSMTGQNGQSLFTVHVAPGSVIGLPAAISNMPYSLNATALAGAKIGFIGCDDLHALMQAEPLLSLKMLQILAAEVRTARKAIY